MYSTHAFYVLLSTHEVWDLVREILLTRKEKNSAEMDFWNKG